MVKSSGLIFSARKFIMNAPRSYVFVASLELGKLSKIFIQAGGAELASCAK
jgi:hypothetical protein